MNENAKRIDYITRAIRETEAPILQHQIEIDKKESLEYIQNEYNAYKQKAENYLKNVSMWKEIIPIVEPEITNFEDIIIEQRCNKIKEELQKRRNEDLRQKEEEIKRQKEMEDAKREEEKKKEKYVPPSQRSATSSGTSFSSSNYNDNYKRASNLGRDTPSKVTFATGSTAGKYVPPSRRR